MLQISNKALSFLLTLLISKFQEIKIKGERERIKKKKKRKVPIYNYIKKYVHTYIYIIFLEIN